MDLIDLRRTDDRFGRLTGPGQPTSELDIWICLTPLPGSPCATAVRIKAAGRSTCGGTSTQPDRHPRPLFRETHVARV